MKISTTLHAKLRSKLEAHVSTCTSEAMPDPLPVDRYIAMSALQKAVRRGNETAALRAAARLLTGSIPGFWRRMTIIAFEDIGAANIDLVGQVALAASDGAFRAELGGDTILAKHLVCALCNSRKDRCVDDLLVQLIHDPELSETAKSLDDMDFDARLARAINCTWDLGQRGLASWYATGNRQLNSDRVVKVKGNAAAYFGALGEYEDIAEAAEIAWLGWKVADQSMPPLFPIVAHVLKGSTYSVCDDVLTPETTVSGVMSSALDMHTRVGLAAYGKFLKAHSELSLLIREHGLPDISPRKQLGRLVFRVESVLETNRLQWRVSHDLRNIADCLGPGLPPDLVFDALALLHESIDLLNECRDETFRNWGR